MKTTTISDPDKRDNNPLTDFSNCHIGIINNFKELLTLPDLAAKPETKKEAKKLAKKVCKFFKKVVIEHHAEEENELFTAVLDNLGDDGNNDQNRNLAKKYINQLTSEHRRLEKLWSIVKPDIKRLSKGKAVSLDRETIKTLATEYMAHARFEEEYFLPLSEKILSDKGLSALGLSLHMRRDDYHIQSYL